MRDTDRTGAQPTPELMPRQPRHDLHADMEFIGDFDVMHATGVDISSGGICFSVAEPLVFEMRFTVDGVTRQRRARLVWARQVPGEGCRLGFSFENGSSEPAM